MPFKLQPSVYPDGSVTLSYRRADAKIQGRKIGQSLNSFLPNTRAKRKIKRAVNGYARVNKYINPIMLTLTTNRNLPDTTFKRYVSQLIKTGTSLYSGFKEYVVVYELTKKARLHAHILLFNSIPEDVYFRLQNLWIRYYKMGNFGFDTKYIKGDLHLASSYLSITGKYLVKRKNTPRKISDRLFVLSRKLQPYTLPVNDLYEDNIPTHRLTKLRDHMDYEEDYFMTKQMRSFSDGLEFFGDFGIRLELNSDFKAILNAR